MLLKGDQSQSEREITVLMNELLNFRPQHAIDCNGAGKSVEIVKHLLSDGAHLGLRAGQPEGAGKQIAAVHELFWHFSTFRCNATTVSYRRLSGL